MHHYQHMLEMVYIFGQAAKWKHYRNKNERNLSQHLQHHSSYIIAICSGSIIF
jgi:hypothetical protein